MKKCSMQKKKESLTRKTAEGYMGDLSVSAEDVIITVDYAWDSGDSRSFAVDVPAEGKAYGLAEFKETLKDMAEDSGGYFDVTRDGSDVVVEFYVPSETSDDYDNVLTLRGLASIVSTSVESIVDYISL